MSETDASSTPLLQELLRLPPHDRLARLRAHGPPAEVLTSLVEETRGLLIADLAAASASTEALVELADRLGDPAVRARARRARGQALAYGNRFDEALETWAACIEHAERAGDRVEAARARMAMLHGLARLGRLDEAVEAGEAAHREFVAAGETTLAAKADANLGEAHRMRNDPARALACLDRARAVLASDPIVTAQLDSNRAEALLDLNRFAEARSTFEAALSALTDAGMARGAAIVEGNLADLMSRQGCLERAIYHFEQARRFFERDGAAGDHARLRAEEAEAFAAAGLMEDAADAYGEARPDLARHGLASEAARAGLGHGRVLTWLGDLDGAAAAFRAADRGFRSLDHAAGIGRVRLAEGDLATARGETTPARAHYAVALRLLWDRPAEAAMCRAALASLLVADRRLGEAEPLLEDAIETASRFDLAPLLGELLSTRARLRSARGDSEFALADLRGAVRQVERVRGTLQAGRFRASFRGQRQAVYEDLVTQLLARSTPGAAAEAFAVVEQARSRSLLEMVGGAIDFAQLAGDEAADPGAAALVRRVSEVRGELNGLYSRLSETNGTERDASWFREWQTQVHATECALQLLENRLSATQGLGGVLAPPVDLAGAQRLLDPDVQLIEYFVTRDEVHAFVVDHERIDVVPALAARDDLVEHVERFQFQIGRVLGFGARARGNAALVEDARRELHDLHRLLIAPLEDRLHDESRLVVVPHGPLHLVPFHALFDGARYLIEDREIVIAPSASLLRHLTESLHEPARRRGEGAALVVAVADENAPRLEDEARAVAATLRGARVLIGAEATCDRVAEAARGASLIHLACHGRFSAASPLSSGLRLADRWLTVREIYGLHLDRATVVLSGCDTGRTHVGAGDELVGLVRGLFAGGAGALVMSLWTLEDRSGEELMAKTYALWQNSAAGRGKGLASALRSAMLESIECEPHPVFWAPFVLMGRP